MKQFPYEDILNQSYPTPEIEKDFPDRVLREAQFSPFAALTGHDAAVEEMARITQKRQELDEDAKTELDRKIRRLDDAAGQCQEITVTYYCADERKEGGAYFRYVGLVTDIRDYERKLVFADGTEIPMEDIVEIEGDIYDEFLNEQEEKNEML